MLIPKLPKLTLILGALSMRICDRGPPAGRPGLVRFPVVICGTLDTQSSALQVASVFVHLVEQGLYLVDGELLASHVLYLVTVPHRSPAHHVDELGVRPD